MNENIKRYAISTLVTFLSGFALVFLAQIDNLTLESLKDGTIMGVVFAALRAGVKAIIEAYLETRPAR